MRNLTIKQASDEIDILDAVSVGLHDAIQKNYNDLRANSPAVKHGDGDIELAANLHNISLSLNEALEEVARRGYGRVVFVREENDAGQVIRNGTYRVSNHVRRVKISPRAEHSSR